MKKNRLFFTLFLGIIILGQQNLLAFRFAWFSDTHVSETTSGAADLSAAVHDVNGLDSIAFILVSGDITDLNIDDNMLHAKMILDSLKRPYYIIPGNHDTKWSDTGNRNFIRLWGSDKFVFDYRGIKFIGLHQGPYMHMTDGHFSPEDLRWLGNLLKSLKDKNQPLIFVTHYPINPSIDNFDLFLNLVKGFNVRMILNGHGHRNRAENFAGIPGVMCRSTLRARKKVGGYTLVNVKKDSVYFYLRLNNGTNKGLWETLPLLQPRYTVIDSQIRPVSTKINQAFPQVKELWRYDSGHLLTGSPIAADGLVFFGDASGVVQALDLKTGRQRWYFKCKGAIYATGAAAAGHFVVFPATDGVIYALNSQSGKLLWRRSTGKALVATPVIENGIIYLGGSDHIFRAINLQNGKVYWTYKGVKGFVQSKPLVYRGKVIFGAWDRTLYALNKKDGSLSWKWQGVKPHIMFSPAACWPVAADNHIFMASPDRFLNVISADSGKTVWRSNSFKVRESVGLSENAKRLFAKTMNDTVFAVSATADKAQYAWIKNFGYGYDHTDSMLEEKDGIVYFAVRSGLLLAFNGADGRLLWKHRFYNTFINTVQPVGHQKVLVGNMDGKIALIGF